jgi:cytoskeleton-associated protein 5
LILEATARFVKSKMKDWKESNVNLIKESINVLKSMTESCDRVPKRALHIYAPFLCDKIGDVKVCTMVKELLMALTDFVTAKYVAQQVAKFGMTAKAPKNVEQSVLIMVTLLEEWGASMMPIKEVLDFGVCAALNTNA